MEITNKDKKLLVYLLALSIIAGSYFFAARPFLNKQMELSEEVANLQQQVNHYNQIYANQSDYETKTEQLNAEYEEMLTKFFSGLDQDNTIMMVREKEKDTGVWIEKLAFQESQVMVGASSEASTDGSEGTEEVVEETQPTVSLSGLKQDLSIDYSGDYASFKKFLEQVKNNDKRLYISSLSAAYSLETGRVTGNLMLSQYALDGSEIEKTSPDLSGVSLGVGNIFTSGSASEASFGTLENTTEEGEAPSEEDAEGSDETNESNDSENAQSSEEQAEPAPASTPSKPQGPAGGII